MKNNKPKIIVMSGPTASGKSDAAIRLAKAINGEIISADSRQIYRGLDIGSGKVIKDFTVDNRQSQVENIYISEGIAHHLIDITDPMEDFNVSHFKKAAENAIVKIVAKGKIPIICGGTGFWISALVDNISLPNVEPDMVLRNELRSKTAVELFEKLKKLDPQRAETIDKNNPVRLIRAIEIATKLGSVPKMQNTIYNIQNTEYDFLQLGIDVPREALNEKIKKRLDQRFDEDMLEEVENLHKNGVAWEWLEKIGLEYRWIARHLQNKISLEEMRTKLYFDIIHYAKRQMTWLKKEKEIKWVKNYNEIEKEAKNFLKITGTDN